MRKDPVGEGGEVVFTERELDVMNVLWESGTATVAEVRERLPDELAYTTVLTILRTLEKKGYVGHSEEGRAHRYHPTVERDAARASHLRRLVRKLFSGSPGALAAHLVSEEELSQEDVRKLRELLEERTDPTRSS